jgi:hypothetical protein
LSPIERKNSWQLAEQAGERHPDNFQHLLNRATWSPDACRMTCGPTSCSIWAIGRPS